MFGLGTGETVLFVIALFAATVNGALGYGFSSMTVPVALLFFPNKVLSPALVLIELAINAIVVVMNRQSLSGTWRRTIPILAGLLPGVLVGSYLLSTVNPGPLKFCTFVVILPLILMQAAGYRRPIRAERAAGVPLGVGVGVLYSTTTISGPPLALMLNNQGVNKEEFRAALGTVRIAETVLTTITYAALGLFSAKSVRLLAPTTPAVFLGLPLGAFVVRRIPTEAFRRTCMSFDAWVVGCGLCRSTIELKLLSSTGAYSVWTAVIAFDLYLLYGYFVTGRFSHRHPTVSDAEEPAPAGHLE